MSHCGGGEIQSKLGGGACQAFVHSAGDLFIIGNSSACPARTAESLLIRPVEIQNEGKKRIRLFCGRHIAAPILRPVDSEPSTLCDASGEHGERDVDWNRTAYS